MTDMPSGPAEVLDVPGAQDAAPDEILIAFAEPAAQNRLTVLVRIILAIPHLVVLWALGIAAEVVLVICWFAALVLGRLPEGLASFLAGYLRWNSRVQCYLFLLTDQYPPFELGDVDYPVRLLIRPGRLNRLAVLFRIILAIPAALLGSLVIFGMETLVMFVTWLIVLISGQMPRPLHEAIAAGARYYIRYTGYLFLLTGTYPWGLFGDQPGLPGALPPMPGTMAGAAPGQPWAAPGKTLPEYGQPGYGQPAPAESGYAQPAPGQPGYGQPAYGQPAYQEPGYAMAGSGQPAYPGPGYEVADPGYGQPAAPVQWLGGDRPWRLVLSGTAKGLVAMFLAIGALVFVAYIVIVAVAVSHKSALTKAEAAQSVEASFATLDTTLSTFDSETGACQGRLSCVNKVDARMSQAFANFANDMAGKAMPTPESTAAATTVQADAARIGQDFHALGGARSVAQYRQIVLRTGLQEALTTFDADYRHLGQTLNAG